MQQQTARISIVGKIFFKNSVRKVIEKNIERELYIAKSKSLFSLHNFLLQRSCEDDNRSK
jgi:hypothetical protein